MNVDVIVVGGGVLGRAIADRLAQSQLHTACIYPRAQVLGQASAAAGGMLGVFSEVSAHDPPARTALEVSQRWQARQLYDSFTAELSARADLPITLTRGLFVLANALGDDDAAELAAMRAAAHDHARAAETLSGRAVPGLAPQTGAAAFEALYLPDEGSVDAGQLLAALERSLERSAYATLVDARVHAVGLDGDDVSVQLASGDTMHGKQVVLACGAETTHLLQRSRLIELGVPPIFAGRGVSLLLDSQVALPHPIRTPNRGFACGLHLVPRAGVTYLGATNRFSTAPDFERCATLGEINNLLSGAIRELNSAYQHAELKSVAVGYRPVTIDRLPVVGRTRDPRVLIATGTYRNGILLAPLVAQLLAAEICAPHTHAQHPFAVLRAMQPTHAHNLDAWLNHASRSLMVTLREPGGQLPNGHDEQLQKFIYAMLSMVLNPAYDAPALRQRIERLMARAPLEENIPLLFDMIARYA